MIQCLNHIELWHFYNAQQSERDQLVLYYYVGILSVIH